MQELKSGSPLHKSVFMPFWQYRRVIKQVVQLVPDSMPTGTDCNREMKTNPQIFLKIFLNQKSHNCHQNH